MCVDPSQLNQLINMADTLHIYTHLCVCDAGRAVGGVGEGGEEGTEEGAGLVAALWEG